MIMMRTTTRTTPDGRASKEEHENIQHSTKEELTALWKIREKLEILVNLSHAEWHTLDFIDWNVHT